MLKAKEVLRLPGRLSTNPRAGCTCTPAVLRLPGCACWAWWPVLSLPHLSQGVGPDTGRPPAPVSLPAYKGEGLLKVEISGEPHSVDCLFSLYF